MRFTHSRWTALAMATAGLLVAAAVVTGFARSERQQNEKVARALTGGDPTRAADLIRDRCRRGSTFTVSLCANKGDAP